MDDDHRLILREIQQSQPQTVDEVYDQLNLIQRLAAVLDADSEFNAAILEAINSLAEAMEGMDSGGGGGGGINRVIELLEAQVQGRVQTTNLPVGISGRAAEEIPNEGSGIAVFQISGSNYTVEVTANEDIGKRDPVVVTGEGNEVSLITDVGDVLGDELIGAAEDFNYTETQTEETPDGNVEIEPGETRTVVEGEILDSGFWLLVGTNDETYSRYRYFVGGQPVFEQALKQPLGLYNDPFRFPKALSVDGNIEVRVTRDESAPGPQEYFSKIAYIA